MVVFIQTLLLSGNKIISVCPMLDIPPMLSQFLSMNADYLSFRWVENRLKDALDSGDTEAILEEAEAFEASGLVTLKIGPLQWKHPSAPLLLISWAVLGETGKILALQERGVAEDFPDEGNAALWAAAAGQTETLKILNLNVREQTEDGENAVFLALRERHLKTLEYLAERGMPLDGYNNRQQKPLSMLLRDGTASDLPLLRWMLEHKASPNDAVGFLDCYEDEYETLLEDDSLSDKTRAFFQEGEAKVPVFFLSTLKNDGRFFAEMKPFCDLATRDNEGRSALEFMIAQPVLSPLFGTVLREQEKMGVTTEELAGCAISHENLSAWEILEPSLTKESRDVFRGKLEVLGWLKDTEQMCLPVSAREKGSDGHPLSL